MLYVALGAVALAIVEALPSDLYAHAPAAQKEVARTAHEEPIPAPVEIVGDSFSSPILARHVAVPASLGLQPTVGPVEPVTPLPGVTFSGVGPSRQGQGPRMSLGTPENRGTDRQLKRDSTRTILVTAIVQAGDLEALIAMDGKDSQAHRVGDQLGPGIKLIAIKDSKVVIGLGHQRKVIYLGQVTEL
jgi:hypothetical protein